MLIYHGVKVPDLAHLIVWPTDSDDITASRGWGIAEAIAVTYRNLVDAANLKGSSEPELTATLAITKALETGADLMRIGFGPTPEMITEISVGIGAGSVNVNPGEQTGIQDLET